MNKVKMLVEFLRKIVWLKLALDIFSSVVILYLIVQFFLYDHITAPLWMVKVYKIVLTTFVFSHEAARWISGYRRGADQHYSWYFDHGEIYVVGWILSALFLWIMQGILKYPEPKIVIDLTLWAVGAYAGSRISKEVQEDVQKYKEEKK